MIVLSLLVTTASLLASGETARAATPSYASLTEIPVQQDGGWDYLSVDAASRRLFVSHGDRVMVIDTGANKVIGSLEGTKGVHGIAIADDLGRAFTSDGGENMIGIFDLKTLALVAKANAGQGPDAIVYDPAEQEVYAFNGKSSDATVINGKTGAAVATIALPGKPEFAAVDPALHRVYVNIEDKSELVAIDSQAHKIVATWPIAPGEEASGLNIDTVNHRLLVGCHNQLLLVVDGVKGTVLDKIAIGTGVDSVWFDPALKLAYTSNGEGSVTIASLAEGARFTPVQSLKTLPRARTMALDTETHRIYLPIADFKPSTQPNGRPQQVPGTFRVLVYELQN